MTTEKYNSFDVRISDISTDSGRDIPGRKAVVRVDNGRTLAVVSDKYQLIEHDVVLGLIRPLMNGVGKHKEVITLDRNGCTMNCVFTYRDNTIPLKVGDKVGMQIFARNSYDGSSSLVIKIGALVLSCLNGMISSGPNFKNIYVRHTGGKEQIFLPEPGHFAEAFSLATEQWNTYSSVKLNEAVKRNALGYYRSQGIIGLETEYKGDSTKMETVWDLMQFLTQDITHNRPKMTQDARIKLLEKVDRLIAKVAKV
jgi:hypothetical protein